MVTAHKGYTLIETIIVIAVMAVIAVIAFFGINSARENEKLANAQKELLVNLRSAQNKAMAGDYRGGMFTFSVVSPSVYRIRVNYRDVSGNPIIKDLDYQIPGLTVTSSNTFCFFNPAYAQGSYPCNSSTSIITLTNNSNGATKLVGVDAVDNKVTVIKPL